LTSIESRPPLQPGEPAPNFTLPAVDRDGTVSLADYGGGSGCGGMFVSEPWLPKPYDDEQWDPDQEHQLLKFA